MLQKQRRGKDYSFLQMRYKSAVAEALTEGLLVLLGLEAVRSGILLQRRIDLSPRSFMSDIFSLSQGRTMADAQWCRS